MIRPPDLSVAIMQIATRLALPAEQEWMRAMEAEVLHARQAGEGIAFALGCLGSVAWRRAASPAFLASATQTTIAIGLLTLSACGVWLSGHVSEDLPSSVLLAASISYAIGGLLAVWSARALRIFVSLGAAISAFLACWFASVSNPEPLQNYFVAIGLEALTLFAGLALASTAIVRWRAASAFSTKV